MSIERSGPKPQNEFELLSQFDVTNSQDAQDGIELIFEYEGDITVKSVGLIMRFLRKVQKAQPEMNIEVFILLEEFSHALEKCDFTIQHLFEECLLNCITGFVTEQIQPHVDVYYWGIAALYEIGEGEYDRICQLALQQLLRKNPYFFAAYFLKLIIESKWLPGLDNAEKVEDIERARLLNLKTDLERKIQYWQRTNKLEGGDVFSSGLQLPTEFMEIVAVCICLNEYEEAYYILRNCRETIEIQEPFDRVEWCRTLIALSSVIAIDYTKEREHLPPQIVQAFAEDQAHIQNFAKRHLEEFDPDDEEELEITEERIQDMINYFKATAQCTVEYLDPSDLTHFA